MSSPLPVPGSVGVLLGLVEDRLEPDQGARQAGVRLATQGLAPTRCSRRTMVCRITPTAAQPRSVSRTTRVRRSSGCASRSEVAPALQLVQQVVHRLLGGRRAQREHARPLPVRAPGAGTPRGGRAARRRSRPRAGWPSPRGAPARRDAAAAHRPAAAQRRRSRSSFCPPGHDLPEAEPPGLEKSVPRKRGVFDHPFFTEPLLSAYDAARVSDAVGDAPSSPVGRRLRGTTTGRSRAHDAGTSAATTTIPMPGVAG